MRVQKILDIIILAMGFMVCVLCACTHLKPFTDISPTRAEELIRVNRADPHFIILDVRTPEEYAPEHLEGAINIDFKASDFTTRLDSLNKSSTYMVYCRSGGRSAKALALMKTKGFRRAYNLQGGIIRWKSESRSIQTR